MERRVQAEAGTAPDGSVSPPGRASPPQTGQRRFLARQLEAAAIRPGGSVLDSGRGCGPAALRAVRTAGREPAPGAKSPPSRLLPSPPTCAASGLPGPQKTRGETE